MTLLAREIRFVVRRLHQTPAFAVLSVLVLGLTIGACTVIYSLVDAVALRPLPYPDPEHIVQLSQLNQAGQPDPFSDLNFEDVQSQALTVEAMAEFSPGTTSVVAGTLPLRVGHSTVSRDFFRVMATYPVRGRAFAREELHEGGTPGAVVSFRFWQDHFADLQDLSAAHLRIDGDPYPIVGIMAAGFNFPGGVDIWTPREARPRNPFRRGQNWQVVARIKPGVSLAAARADLTAVARRLQQQYASSTSMSDIATIPLREELVGSVRPLLYLLLTSVLFLLLVACANLANMLLARASTRTRELAIRSALGATGASLLLPLVAESVMVAALGGIAGILIAFTSLRALAFVDLRLPRIGEVRLSWDVLAFTVGVTMLTAVILGLAAGWHASRPGRVDWTRETPRGHTAGRSMSLIRHVLVVAQLVVSVVLLIGAGLLGRSFAALLSQDPGFRRDGLLTIDLSNPGPKVHPTPLRLEFDDPSRLPRQARLNEQLLERLRTLPGVVEAGGISRFPMGGPGSSGTFVIARPTDEFRTMQDFVALANLPDRTGHADFRVASAGYFRAMGIPLVRGRLFEERDGADAPHVALISESLARSRWPGQDPIGTPVEFGGMDGDLRLFTIVGVVGDVKERGLDSPPQPTFYGEYRQRPLGTFDFTIVLHTGVDPLQLVAGARRIIQDLSPEVPPQFRSIDAVIAESVANRRLTFMVTASFAVAALLVAVFGLYGVLSYLVAQRRREFGVRIALGASASDVQRLVLGDAMKLVFVGLLVGVGTALGTSRVLKSMMFGITSTDLVTYMAVAGLLALVALVACEMPAYRATRVDPAESLRAE